MSTTVSVIIPVYNGAAFIARAIDSALAQSHRACEIIVVNDGSSDQTADILGNYGAPVRVLNIPNGGVSNARNVGMRAASGELIAFLDADDSWHPNKLRMQVAALEAYPRAALCCCDYVVLNKHLGHVVNHFSSCQKGMTFDRPFTDGLLATLIRCNFVGTASSVVLRRSLVDQVGAFNTGYRQAEDFDYWLRCAAHAPFIVLSARLMEKHSHGCNLTNDSIDTLQCHEQVLQHLPQAVWLPAREAGLLPRALADVRLALARQFFEQGAYSQGLRWCVLGLAADLSLPTIARIAVLLCKKTLRVLAPQRPLPQRLPHASLGHSRAE